MLSVYVVRRLAGAASDSSDDDDMAQLQTLLQGGLKPTTQSRQLARLLQRGQPPAVAAGTPESQKVSKACGLLLWQARLHSCTCCITMAVRSGTASAIPPTAARVIAVFASVSLDDGAE